CRTMCSLRHGAPISRTLGGSNSHIYKEVSIPSCLLELGYSVKNLADFREFTLAQLWSPRIVAGFTSDNAFVDQRPNHAGDVALHRQDKESLTQFVHQPRQGKELRGPALEVGPHEVGL